ncbi:MAG: hypothetical protein ABSF28_15495 [Terracidiphilus sp.]
MPFQAGTEIKPPVILQCKRTFVLAKCRAIGTGPTAAKAVADAFRQLRAGLTQLDIDVRAMPCPGGGCPDGGGCRKVKVEHTGHGEDRNIPQKAGAQWECHAWGYHHYYVHCSC